MSKLIIILYKIILFQKHNKHAEVFLLNKQIHINILLMHAEIN